MWWFSRAVVVVGLDADAHGWAVDVPGILSGLGHGHHPTFAGKMKQAAVRFRPTT
jgi:hypothetical protein